jgi:hypothetical protein
MKLLIMQFPPISRHFIPLWSKYSPRHPVLKHPQFMFLCRSVSKKLEKTCEALSCHIINNASSETSGPLRNINGVTSDKIYCSRSPPRERQVLATALRIRGSWTQLHIVGPQNLCSSPDIVGVIKSRKTNGGYSPHEK